MKKLLSVLVVLSMLVASMSGLTLFAAADTTTLTAAEDGYYYISTAAEFNLISATEATLAEAKANPGNYRITADITEAITTSIPAFSGTVTGWDLETGSPAQRVITIALDGHENSSPVTYYGLFNSLNNKGSLSYLTINGSVTITGITAVTEGGTIGALAGYTAATANVNHIINNADVLCVTVIVDGKSKCPNTAGGVVGCANGTVTDCLNTATVIAKSYSGGIIGQSTTATTVAAYERLVNKGIMDPINSSGSAGGISGSARVASTFKDCYNIGELKGGANYGIAAYYHDKIADKEATISANNCYTTGGYEILPTLSTLTSRNNTNATASASYLTINTDNSYTAPVDDAVLTSKEALMNAGWDFENVWTYDEKNQGYKYPQFENMFVERTLPKDENGFYYIYTAEDFALISKDLAGDYRIAADIEDTITESITGFTGSITGWDKETNLPAMRKLTIELDDGDIGYFNSSSPRIGLFPVATADFSYLELYGSVSASASALIGGALVGNITSGSISNIINNASVTLSGSSSQAGGIVGGCYVAVNNCFNNADVTATYLAGGIAATIANVSEMTTLSNKGIISTTGATSYAAGLFAQARYVINLKNSYNIGMVSGKKGSYAVIGSYHGSIVGTLGNEISINYCYDANGLSLMPDKSTITGLSVSANECYGADEDIAVLNDKETLMAKGWDFENIWDYDESNYGYTYPQFKGMFIDKCLEKDESGAYLIRNAAEFAFINEDIDGDYKIIADITDVITEPIHNFTGTITGWDKELNKPVYRKLNIELDAADERLMSSGAARIGLFAISKNADFSYLELNGNISSASKALIGGGLVGDATGGTILNIVSNVNISLTGSSAQAGGIVGNCYASISNCSNNKTVKATYLAGGIAAIIANKTEINSVRNNGQVISTAGPASGLFAQARYVVNLKNAFNSGEISGRDGSYAFVGLYHSKIVGTTAETISFNYCYDAKGNAFAPDTSSVTNLSITSNECYTGTENDALLKDKEALIAKGWDFESVWDYDDNNRAYKYPQLKGLFISTKPGTIANPMDIATPEEFFALKDAATAGIYYELVDDIDLSEVEGYEPFVFNGTLYGNDKTITPSEAGIFSEINGAEITDLVIGEGVVTSEKTTNDFGALAWLAASSTLTDVTNYADVSAKVSNVGGLVGLTNYGKVILNNCENHGDISSEEGNIGGLVGWTSNGGAEINGGINTGNISGSSSIGGFVGNNTLSLIIKDAVNLGNVVSYGSPGPGGSAAGFLGHHKYDADGRTAVIENCYNAGIVSVLFDKKGYSRYNPVAAQYTTEKTSTLTVKDSYYLAVDTENDVDLYSGTTALSLDDFNAKISALGYSPIEAYILEISGENENGFVTPLAPSSKIYAIKGSDVVVTAFPDEYYKLTDATLNGEPVVFTADVDGYYYTYLIENISKDSVVSFDFAEMLVADIMLPEAAYDFEIKQLIGLNNYNKLDASKPVMLIYGKVLSGFNKFEKLGITIGDAYDVEVNLNKDGEFAAFIYSTSDILTADEAVSVRAYGINSEGDKLEAVISDSEDNSVNATPFIIK